ncbi:hypothetical protein [Bradyrhizobium valentinum]|uniref:hypothetical protein n=1 Tax=Bradyrhizobium valentinum TaxID=1518501 RepID=UPI0007100E72|nr:hypothetical protein [Bradyrhizobium valentinum]KRR05653.1 hypothetical protein CQ10_16615 [Bradyrhizobium valentinum]
MNIQAPSFSKQSSRTKLPQELFLQIYRNKLGHADHAIARLPLTWWERACFRSKLREDIRDRSDFLRDVGIDVLEAHAEACRFFWQPITLKRLPILDYAPATAAIARSAVEAVGSRYCADNALNHQSAVVS